MAALCWSAPIPGNVSPAPGPEVPPAGAAGAPGAGAGMLAEGGVAAPGPPEIGAAGGRPSSGRRRDGCPVAGVRGRLRTSTRCGGSRCEYVRVALGSAAVAGTGTGIVAASVATANAVNPEPLIPYPNHLVGHGLQSTHGEPETG